MSDVMVDWKEEYLKLKRGVIEYHQALGEYSTFKIQHKSIIDLNPADLVKAKELGESLAISTAVLEQLLAEDPQQLANIQADNVARTMLDAQTEN